MARMVVTEVVFFFSAVVEISYWSGWLGRFLIESEIVRIGAIGVLDAVGAEVAAVLVGLVVDALFKLVLDVVDRHRVSLGKEIPKAAIRKSNANVDKKLKVE